MIIKELKTLTSILLIPISIKAYQEINIANIIQKIVGRSTNEEYLFPAIHESIEPNNGRKMIKLYILTL